MEVPYRFFGRKDGKSWSLAKSQENIDRSTGAERLLEDDFFDSEIDLKANKTGLIQALEWGAKQVTK